MPFGSEARIEVTNDCDSTLVLYFYADYEEYDRLDDRELRFHAWWNRENPCKGISDSGISNEEFEFGGRTPRAKATTSYSRPRARGITWL